MNVERERRHRRRKRYDRDRYAVVQACVKSKASK